MTYDPQELRRIGGAPDTTECAECHRDETECICNGPPLVEPMPLEYPRVYLSRQLWEDLIHGVHGEKHTGLMDCVCLARDYEQMIRAKRVTALGSATRPSYWQQFNLGCVHGQAEPFQVWPVEGGGVIACYASESDAYSTEIDLSDESDLNQVTRYGYLGCQIVRKYHTIQGENQPDEWTWSHPDYDGESSRLCGYGRTETDCESQIDELVNDLIHERCQDAIDQVHLAVASHAEVSGLVAIVNRSVARAFRDGLNFGSAK